VLHDIISVRDLSNLDIQRILEVAGGMEKPPPLLKGKQVALLFFEPSTRTRLSFECAIQRLGGRSLDLKPKMSSLIKGESFSNTVRVIASYCDAMVIRHPKEGAARLAADLVDIPVINGGDGSNQHPTQTLLDLYAIKRKKEKLSGLKVTLVGDLKHGRTVHSLSYALDRFGSRVRLVSPDILDLPAHIKSDLSSCERISLDQAIKDSDVLYVTRIQKERFSDPAEYEKLKKSYKITAELLKDAPRDLIVMHPLPIVDEISYDVDNFHGIYFEQSAGGVPVRMALLAMVMGTIK
jgi:aspartate carbamoyltransferase catalytic subunit